VGVGGLFAPVGDELDTVPALALCGGPAIYLFAYVALRLRVARTFGRGRLIAAIACALLWPIAMVLPALGALTLVATVWVALHASSSSGGAKPARRPGRCACPPRKSRRRR